MSEAGYLSLIVDSTSVAAGDQALDKIARTGARVEAKVTGDMRKVSAAMAGVGKQAQVSATGIKSFTGALSNNHGLRMASLQIGQVFQQMSAGTSAARALAIQLPDLFLGFGTIGALAGVAAGAMAPLIERMFETEDASKAAEEALDRFLGALSDYDRYTSEARRSLKDLSAEFGSFADEIQRASLYLADVSVGRSLETMRTEGAAFFTGLKDAIPFVNELSNAQADLAREVELGGKHVGDFEAILRSATFRAQEAAAVIGLMPDQVKALDEAFAAVRGADGMIGIRDAANEALNLIREMYPEGAKLPPALHLSVQELENILRASASTAHSLNEGTGAAVNLSSQLSVAASEAARLAANLAQAPAGIEAFQQKAAQVTAQIAALDAGLGQAGASAAGLRVQLEQKYGLAEAANDAERAYISGLINRQVAEFENVEKLNKSYTERITLLNKVAKAGGKAADGLTKAEKEALKLQRQIDQGVTRSVYDLTDVISEGLLSGFDGTLSSIGDIFKSWLAKMISTAIANPILVSMGINPAGFVGGGLAAASLGGSGGGGGGILGGAGNLLGLGNLFGGGGFIGSTISGIGSGLGGVLSGGGIGSSFANLGGLVTGASSGLGAIGAALPALGIIAGIGVLLSKAFSREYAGTALRGTLGAEGFDGTSFDFYKGGALRSNKANYKDAPPELVAYLDAAMMGVTKSISTYADALSLDIGDALQRTGDEFTVWLNGKSQEEIIEALNSQVQTVADEMAELVLGTDEFSRSGESALDTLTRLGSSLLSVNDAMLLLNHAAFATSLAAANTASDLVDQFGGIDAMNAAISTFWQAFYTDAERNEGVLRQLNAQFDRLNIAMPQSRAAYRALIEAQDLNTERGRELYAQLIGLAGAMDQVLPKVAEFTASMAGLLGQIGGQVGSLLDASRENARMTQSAAQLWYRTAETLRDFIRDLTNSDVSPVSTSQQLGINRGRFNTAFEMVKGGDVQAAQDLPGLARALLDSELANARTAAEFRAISARVQSQVAFAAGIADLEGANQDVLTTLYEQQIEVLANLASFLQLEGLTNEQIGQLDASIQDLARDFDGTLATFDTALGSLEDAIKEAELFSYDYLKERLRVAVDILPSANIPQYLKNLIQQADEGITATIDFVVRSQLPAPEKWLAVNSASEHIKTLDFVLRNDVSNQTRALALVTGSELRRNIRFLLTQDVDAETRRIALAGNSELSRVVNVALDMAGSDQRALMLALRGIGDYAVAVNLAFGPNMSQDIRRVVLRQSGGYAAMVQAAFTQLSGSARRVLLQQQGTYAANITGVILASVPDNIKRLLLNANTAAVRAVTIGSAFASSVTPQERDLLMQQGTTTLRTIQARVNPLDLSPIAVKLVNQLAMGNGSIARGIEGRLWQTNWTATDQRFLDQLATGGGHIARGIEGRLWQTGWTATDEMMLRQLGLGDGIVSRGIYSNFASNVDAQDARMLVQLGFGNGTVARNISSFFNANPNSNALRVMYQLEEGNGTVGRHIYSNFASNVDNQDALMLRQLGLGSGSIARGIEGRMWQTGWTVNDQRFLDQLATNGGSIARGIEGRLWQTNWTATDQRFLDQLATGTGSISRIINGSVNLGNLSASQRNLLSSITGASTGTITLAGTYRFAPEAAFQTWYSSTTKTLIRTPMDALRASLDALRGEFVTQRQTEAAQANQRAQAIASITGTAGAYGNQLTSNRGWAEKLVAKTRELMTRTGTRLFDAQGNAATLAINPDGTINFNGAYASGGDMRAFAAEFWGTGKLNDYMARANSNIEFIEGKLDTARRQIISLGGIPSFAGGGFTGMGMRSGGLDGKGGFLSMLHPRETVIDHTKDNLGAELRALRKEVSALRKENMQLGAAIAKNTKTTADVMRKADKIGMPVRNPDDGTALETV